MCDRMYFSLTGCGQLQFTNIHKNPQLTTTVLVAAARMQTRQASARQRRYENIAAAARITKEKKLEGPRSAKSRPRELLTRGATDHLPQWEKIMQRKRREAANDSAPAAARTTLGASARLRLDPAGGGQKALAYPSLSAAVRLASRQRTLPQYRPSLCPPDLFRACPYCVRHYPPC